MTVGAQHDFGPGPVGADRPEQAAQEAPDLLAARALGGPQDGGDEAPFTIENDDRLKAILVVVSIEQAQLLAAMDGIERIVDVEHDPLGHLMERLQ